MDYAATREVEEKGKRIVIPFLQRNYRDLKELVTEDEQRRLGDYSFIASDGCREFVELKTEATNPRGNFFLETWSNRPSKSDWCYARTGWMLTCCANWLIYCFLDKSEFYVIDFQKLRRWCFEEGNLYKYESAPQKKNKQQNITHGQLVKISDIRKHIGCEHFRLIDGEYERVAALSELPKAISVLSAKPADSLFPSCGSEGY